MFILYLFLILPSFLFLASLVVVGFGEYFVDYLLELGMVVVAFDRLAAGRLIYILHIF